MGTKWGGNGDEQPPGGSGPSDGMSGLPPEWGPIVIPDDASALDDEAAAVRREMGRSLRRDRWRRRLRLGGPGNREAPSLGVPLAIMAIAVVATLISLFAVAWPGGYNGGPPNPDSVTTKARPLTLPDLTLYDTDGVAVRIRDTAPAVVVLVDGCDCQRVVNDLAATVDPRVSVLVVLTPDPYGSASPGASAAGGSASGGSARPGWPSGRAGTPSGAPAGPGIGPWTGAPGTTVPPSARAPLPSGAPIGPTMPATAAPHFGPATSTDRPGAASTAPSGRPSRSGPPGVRVRVLMDPGGVLRASVPGLPSGAATGTILLVSPDWAVVQVVAGTTPVTELKPDLDRLAG
jgi:hypothetical protein